MLKRAQVTVVQEARADKDATFLVNKLVASEYWKLSRG
jgi:hypothetical protein